MKRWFRFSLQGFMIFMFAVTAFLGGLSLQDRKVRQLNAEVRDLKTKTQTRDSEVAVLNSRLKLNVSDALYNARKERSYFVPVEGTYFPLQYELVTSPPTPIRIKPNTRRRLLPKQIEPMGYLRPFAYFPPREAFSREPQEPFYDDEQQLGPAEDPRFYIDQGMMFDVLEREQTYRPMLNN